MTQKQARYSLFVVMLVTISCPSVFLLGNGLLPVSALGLGLTTFVSDALRDSMALVFAIIAALYVVVYAVCLNWLAGSLSQRLFSYRVLGGSRATGLLMAGLLFLAALPVYCFDCMDGAPLRWCNAYELHAGWFSAAEVCGDFRW